MGPPQQPGWPLSADLPLQRCSQPLARALQRRLPGSRNASSSPRQTASPSTRTSSRFKCLPKPESSARGNVARRTELREPRFFTGIVQGPLHRSAAPQTKASAPRVGELVTLDGFLLQLIKGKKKKPLQNLKILEYILQFPGLYAASFSRTSLLPEPRLWGRRSGTRGAGRPAEESAKSRDSFRNPLRCRGKGRGEGAARSDPGGEAVYEAPPAGGQDSV
ncbi:unnamed protein product [Coccothraustes coccothraustes]